MPQFPNLSELKKKKNLIYFSSSVRTVYAQVYVFFESCKPFKSKAYVQRLRTQQMRVGTKLWQKESNAPQAPAALRPGGDERLAGDATVVS